MQRDLTFDPGYRETVSLPGDLQIGLRLLRATDKDLLSHAFTSLSVQSRYRRFFHTKNELTPDELRFFTELDGWNHFAIAAVRLHNGKETDLLGVARFFRLAPGSEVAEVAVAVLDEVQGRGIGRLLLTRLVAAASERNIQRLRFYLLYENRPARNLFEHSAWETTFNNEGTVVAGELKVPEYVPGKVPHHDHEFTTQLEELIDRIAKGAVATPMSLALIGWDGWWRHTRRVLDSMRLH